MDVMHLRTFQRQVFLQCRFMLLAADDINTRLTNRDIDGVFYGIQNILNAGANVSKALWGSGGSKAAERKELRDSIGVTDTSPLREVTMRNNFEHFDERIDRWWEQSPRHNQIDLMIGPRETIAGVEDIDRFRAFDPKTTNMAFWGQEFHIQNLIDEVRRILPTLEEEANKPHWDPDQPEPPAAPTGTPPNEAKGE